MSSRAWRSSSIARAHAASSRRSTAALRSSTAPSSRAGRDPVIRLDERCLAAVELRGADGQLGLAGVELRGAVAENLLDAGVELARPLLTALEVADGRPELLRALLELPPAQRDELGDLVAGVGRAEERREGGRARGVARLRRTGPSGSRVAPVAP